MPLFQDHAIELLVDRLNVAYYVGMTDDNPIGIPSRPGQFADLGGMDNWPTLYPVDDTPEERQLRAISARRKRQDATLAATRAEERAAILAALATGTKQVQICAITGFTREYVRRIERGAVSAPTAEQQERAQ